MDFWRSCTSLILAFLTSWHDICFYLEPWEKTEKHGSIVFSASCLHSIHVALCVRTCTTSRSDLCPHTFLWVKFKTSLFYFIVLLYLFGPKSHVTTVLKKWSSRPPSRCSCCNQCVWCPPFYRCEWVPGPLVLYEWEVWEHARLLSLFLQPSPNLQCSAEAVCLRRWVKSKVYSP